MKYFIRFARNQDIDNIQHETVNAPDEQVARAMFTACDCYIYSCETVVSVDAAHGAGFPNAVLVDPATAGEMVSVSYGTHPLDAQEEVSKRWGVSDEYKNSQPYHNDVYPF